MKKVESLTSKDISIIEFREKLFMEEVEKYVAAITGEQESILPFVRDESGNYSEKKTWEFIQELTKCAHTYWEYEKQKWREERKKEHMLDWMIEDIAGASDAFSVEEEEFLQGFLYCVIRIAEANPWRNTSGVTQSFQDFIRFSRERYNELGELYAAEAEAEANRNHYAKLKGIHRPASWLIHLLTGKYLSDYYTETIEKEYYGYLPPMLREELEAYKCRPSELYDKQLEDMPDEEEIERMCNENEQNFMDSLSEEERAEESLRSSIVSERMQKEEKKKQEEKDRIKQQFVEAKQFMKQYWRFVNGYVCSSYECPLEISERLECVIKGMVRLFTESRGLSRLQDDDSYFSATALLRQSNKRLRILAREEAGRNKHV